MQEKFKFRFNNSLGILHKYYYGSISIADIKSSWEHAFENNLIPKETKGFIVDYRNANLEFEVDEHIKIADFYKDNLEVFGNFKIAVVSDEPKDVVIIILVETKEDGYFSRLFSTVEAATNWVLR
ncbi:MAG: hypothetical protein KAS71_16785 [Bacteroidales bacterium]|nr:hypothetical protein [Bacteroidales bacterium]